MSHLSTVEARNQFSDLVNRVAYGKERVILTRRGKALVAVVPLEDLQHLGLTQTSAVPESLITDAETNTLLAS